MVKVAEAKPTWQQVLIPLRTRNASSVVELATEKVNSEQKSAIVCYECGEKAKERMTAPNRKKVQNSSSAWDGSN